MKKILILILMLAMVSFTVTDPLLQKRKENLLQIFLQNQVTTYKQLLKA